MRRSGLTAGETLRTVPRVKGVYVDWLGLTERASALLVPTSADSETQQLVAAVPRRAQRHSFFLLTAFALTIAFPAFADSMDDSQMKAKSWFSCERGLFPSSELKNSRATRNLLHGTAYLGGVAALNRTANPKRRWSRGNGLDRELRSGFRLGSVSAREDADLASDVFLGVSVLLPVITIGAQFNRTHDCVETWSMVGEAIESFGLTLFITEAVKIAAGRNRPYVRTCDGSPPSDSDCNDDDRHLSFFSGHSSLAAAGAGLTCSYAFKREAWGTSRTAKVAPCALGAAAALTTGALRMASDRHWGTDVLLGFTVGALVGYFDTWGPLDLLKFSTRDSGGRVSSTGIVLPSANNGALGAQVMMVF